MPWHIAEKRAECDTAEPFAVVQDDNDKVVGCHATKADAEKQLAALYANEPNPGGKPDSKDPKAHEAKVIPLQSTNGVAADGHVQVGDGSFMSQAAFERARKWQGVLVVEGTPTGDGREFAPNALEWVDNPIIRWQKETAHGGEHDVTVTVGRADRVWRDGAQIMGEGVLDLKSPDGFEIYRRMNDNFAGGISIDADDITDADIEVVWPDTPDDPTGDDAIAMLFGSPDKLIFHGGRIRAATIVDIPAFVEAKIALVGDDAALVAAVVSPTREHVIPIHTTAVSDAAWSAGKKSIRRDAPADAYAWATRDIGLMLHHDVNGGHVGAANITAVSAALKSLTTMRGVVPEEDERAVYEHLTGHLRDAGLEAPPFPKLDALSAALSNTEEWKPPKVWFENPGLTVPVGITITDQGRIYGHAAQWGECHVGFNDLCVTPPVEAEHSYFMTGEVLCADGSRVAVGQITVATGHAPLSYRATKAAEHYDNTGSAVADVVVGNDDVGIWVAGAVRPHAETARVHDLRAAGRVSGDWRRIGGSLRLVGLLGVNVAGFQLRTRARVASGVPQSLVAAGFMTIGSGNIEAPTEQDHDAEAMRHVMGMLAKRVNA